MLEQAIALAAAAHAGQKDKGGASYILHPLRVMLACHGEDAQICAVLHDVLEDTPWTLDGLRAQGFEENILSALDALTRREGESYAQFIQRLLANPLACQVKLADLADNQDLTRLSTITEADKDRLQRYQWAEETIRAALAKADSPV